jgi:5-methylcytosine-specific restriction endonuclease McrA
MRACPVCEISFVIPAGHERSKIYCSLVCRNAAKQLREDVRRGLVRKPRGVQRYVLLTTTCSGCQESFTQTHPLQKYCSIPCRKRHGDDLGRERGKPWIVNQYANQGGWTPRRQAISQRRSALVRGATAPGESIVPGEVFERDGWICGLCDESVDPALKYPDLMSASLDHVVPVSLHGDHSMANVQCAHLSCNLSKNNRVA